MINIDFLTLRAFFVENIDFFIGARIQKIQQPTRRDFIFSLRNLAESRKLYININPQIYHISFMSKETEEARNLIIPQKPPMFCMLLRKYLDGARIADAKVVENERIIEFLFNTYDELSQPRLLCLCVELMGKHSNIILYDKNTGIIIGCAHNVGEEKSRYRELQGGLKYMYPPKSAGLSKELEEEFKNLPQEKINEYLITDSFRPAISGERYTLFEELLENSLSLRSVNEMLDKYYSKYQEQFILSVEKNKLEEVVKAKLKKSKTAIDKIEKLLKKRDNTEKYKLYGELLTANLYQKADYKDKIEVFDYVNNENITIELDNTKTLNENAQRYFKLYTKSKTTKEKSKELLDKLNIEKEYLENVQYSVSKSDKISDLEDIKVELGIVEQQKQKQIKKIKEKLIKKNISGFDIYVGKNNKQNDYIISKLAKDEDIWFHTRLCAGSHVLLVANGLEPDEETLFECCKLAREYSSATQPSKIGVIYTRAKNLRKPPAAPLGYVTYKNEKEVLV